MNSNLKSNSNIQYVILYDSVSNIEELKQIIKKHNPKIITFSLDSHNFLLQNNIEHELSENYLNETDLDYIQDHSYQFSQWYSHPTVSQSVQYEGINVGELFYVEFCYFLTPILKKIYEMMRIYTAYKTALFFSSSSLVNFLKLFSSNIKILNDNPVSESVITKNKNLKFDINILINNNGNFLVSQIIKISYSLFKIIFQNKKIDKTKQTIFLINYTTKQFQKIFEQLPNYPINLVKYDTVIPAFWNLESLLLIKRSNCYIEHSSSISNYSIPEKNSLVNQQLKDLLEKEKFFDTFFSINNYIFWNLIKDEFIEMYERNYLNTLEEIKKIKFLFKKYNPSYILVHSECAPLDLITIKIAKKFGIKIGLFQHALYNDDLQNSNYYAFKSDQFHRVLPLYSDNFLIWDKLTQNHALKHGVDSKKIIPIGNPFFDIFFDDDKNTANLKNEFILLAITPYTNQNQTRELSTKIQIEYETTIEQICQIITKMNKKLLIKIHHGSFFEQKNIKKINPNIIVKNTGNFYQYAKNCELLICLDMSTAILDAMLLKKPVVSILIRDKDSHSEIFENNYIVKTEISDLEHVLTNLIHDEKFKKSCIEQGEKFIHDYLLNPGHSTKTLLDFLSNMSINEN